MIVVWGMEANHCETMESEMVHNRFFVFEPSDNQSVESVRSTTANFESPFVDPFAAHPHIGGRKWRGIGKAKPHPQAFAQIKNYFHTDST